MNNYLQGMIFNHVCNFSEHIFVLFHFALCCSIPCRTAAAAKVEGKNVKLLQGKYLLKSFLILIVGGFSMQCTARNFCHYYFCNFCSILFTEATIFTSHNEHKNVAIRIDLIFVLSLESIF
jgi:hypothetical protein